MAKNRIVFGFEEKLYLDLDLEFSLTHTISMELLFDRDLRLFCPEVCLDLSLDLRLLVGDLDLLRDLDLERDKWISII